MFLVFSFYPSNLDVEFNSSPIDKYVSLVRILLSLFLLQKLNEYFIILKDSNIYRRIYNSKIFGIDTDSILATFKLGASILIITYVTSNFTTEDD